MVHGARRTGHGRKETEGRWFTAHGARGKEEKEEPEEWNIGIMEE
jgi:hypothetical protein